MQQQSNYFSYRSKPTSRFNWYKIGILIALLTILIGVRIPGIFSLSIWNDEANTLLDTSGHGLPTWPRNPVPALVAKQQFQGAPSFSKIAEDLQVGGAHHPPFYYWALSLWRRWFGFSIETARVFSLVCSIGTLLVFYLLLSVGEIPYPLIPTTIYALSSASVHYAQQARSYALASLLITTGALFAYLAWKAVPRDRVQVAIYSTGMVICCGLALLTNYLALFPVSIILLWFSINLWSVSKPIALLSPLVSISIFLPWLTVLFKHFGSISGSGSEQAVEFPGIFPELKQIFLRNFTIIFGPPISNSVLRYTVYGLLILLVGITVARILDRQANINRRLMILCLGLAFAPSLGIFLLDILSNKFLVQPRYVMFAGPALAVSVFYGITTLKLSWRRLGMLLFAMLLILQVSVINWGAERTRPFEGSRARSFANLIQSSSLPSHIVAISHFYDGQTGLIVSELEPQTMVVTFDSNTDLEDLLLQVQDYDDIWLVFSWNSSSNGNVENDFINRLQKANYTQIFMSRRPQAAHFRRLVNQPSK